VKIVHVPFCFRPDRVGGTEVYVQALAHEQLARGTDVVVAAPGVDNASYAIDGIQVRRFRTGPITNLETLYGAGDEVASRAFGSILDLERPQVVHLHAFTSAASLRTVEEAQRRGIGVVFTYHTPTVSCERGTLLWHGREVCDGTLHVQRCAECALDGLGAGRFGSALFSRVPTEVGGACARMGLSGSRVWTGVQFPHLVSRHHDAVRELMARVQKIVVLCDWSRDVLVRNGVSAEKIVMCRHGLATSDDVPRIPRRKSGPLRVAFLGRVHPTKGLDVLIRAVRLLADVALELHVFGVEQPGDERYARELRRLADGDSRIVFEPAIPSERAIETLQEFDLLAVPSQWLETGPLVVLEAFAAGTPVIGSRLGGVAELVRDGVDGLLVRHDSLGDWAHMLRRLAADPVLLQRLREGVRPPRRMRDVSDDMLSLYAEVASNLETVAV
jgi:glycosyltransferase involved in cell wall biosynthesis